MLHFAGHAYFDADEPARGGLICAGDEVLRGADLDGLGNLPALVFCNACEAARVRRRQAHGRAATVRRAAPLSVAEAFLAGGVANFIGTHWPVGDDAALAFSTTLYERCCETRRSATRCSRRGGASWAWPRSTGPTTSTTAIRLSGWAAFRDRTGISVQPLHT